MPPNPHEMPFNTHTTSGLRGHYAGMTPDWTITQQPQAITPAEHELWRQLYQRQVAVAAQYAPPDFLTALQQLDMAQGVPTFDRLNAVLQQATGFTLVAVPGLIPGGVFFNHLAHRRFPATCWLRHPHEMDYLVEPDVFHDVFGHVPMLLNPDFANYMVLFGQKGPEAQAWDAAHPNTPVSATERLSRLYWFTVEFGLVQGLNNPLKAFGAGILSSYQETPYAVTSPVPNRLPFSLPAVFNQAYRIDQLQTTYFILNQYNDLFEATNQPFAPYFDAE
jgi:phenylalanine-4-hydroxylase